MSAHTKRGSVLVFVFVLVFVLVFVNVVCVDVALRSALLVLETFNVFLVDAHVVKLPQKFHQHSK